MQLPKYSLGLGDRFAHQAEAQLRACMLAQQAQIDITPVWNKSNREHTIVGSDPVETRIAADAAVRKLAWNRPYFVDADHINLDTYDRFAAPCDFFTIDVAEMIGRPATLASTTRFLDQHPELSGNIFVPGIAEPLQLDRAFVTETAGHFLAAIQRAGEIYRAIAAVRGADTFIVEISMDEVDAPQTPVELLVILASIGDENIPIQTIAPKFTGRFNKGVDYVGDVNRFATEFRQDIATIAFAIERYALPKNLKLSVHSGSDKYAIYSVIREALIDLDAGVHIKTAGTTWLEEVIGLAEAGGDALRLAKDIYIDAHAHIVDLCAPYATVIDIDRNRLPTPKQVDRWTSFDYVNALRHDGRSSAYNADFRQLLHVGFKVAAQMRTRYTDALLQNEKTIAKNVTENLYERHIVPIFPRNRLRRVSDSGAVVRENAVAPCANYRPDSVSGGSVNLSNV